MKKWIDADEIIKMSTYIEDNRFRELEKQMQEKPNFNHTVEKNKKRKKRR